jgi:hypothetical protein
MDAEELKLRQKLFFHFNDYCLYTNNLKKNLFEIVDGPENKTRLQQRTCPHYKVFIEAFIMKSGNLMAHAICKDCWDRSDPLNYFTIYNLTNSGKNVSARQSKYDLFSLDEDEINAKVNKIKNMNSSEIHKVAHRFYLGTEKWNGIKNERLAMDNHWCQECKSRPATLVHHLNYDNWMDEKLTDLISLCPKCHENKHQDKIKNKTIKETT